MLNFFDSKIKSIFISLIYSKRLFCSEFELSFIFFVIFITGIVDVDIYVIESIKCSSFNRLYIISKLISFY